MRLRPRRAPVTRLSRKVLIGLGVVAAAGIGAALFFALQPQRQTTGLRTLQHRQPHRRRTASPACHATTAACRASVPQLGPPLPGDLGRPIVNAGAPAPGMPMPASDPEQQRIAQEQEAARTSQLFATTNVRQDVGAAAPTLQPLPRQRHRHAPPSAAIDRSRRRRITSSPSSTAPSIAAPSAPIACRRPRVPMCCRRAP